MVKLKAKKGDIIFTSGATESNNLAILGSKRNGKYEYVFSVGEHPSVYNVAKELERQGNKVYFVPLLSDGKIDKEKLKEILNDKTRLISVMHVSNETGAINDLNEINEIRNSEKPSDKQIEDLVKNLYKSTGHVEYVASKNASLEFIKNLYNKYNKF